MLDFEEELKRFRPSTEIGDVEQQVGAEDITDMEDLMIKMMERETQPQPQVNIETDQDRS